MKRLHEGRGRGSGPQDHGPRPRRTQGHGVVRLALAGVVFVMLLTGAGFRQAPAMRGLQAPAVDLADHAVLRPGVASVVDAIDAAETALAATAYRRGELLDGVAMGEIVRDMAARAEDGTCRRGDVDQVRGAARLVADAGDRVVGAFAFVEAEVLRCLGDEDGAVDAWRRAAVNHRLRPVVAVRLYAADAWASSAALTDPARPGAGAIAAWAARPGDLTPVQRREALALLATARPAGWLEPRIEAARYALLAEDDPRGAAIARARWLADHGENTRWRGRLDALLASADGVEVAATAWDLHDALLSRAERVARAGRRTEARGLVRLAIGQGWLDAVDERAWDEWLGALVDLGSTRHEARGRGRLDALARTGGRVAFEAEWSRIGEARREDRDDEALRRILRLRQRDAGVREAELLDACVVLAGHLGELHTQRACFDLRTARGATPEALALLAVDVVVDHLAQQGVDETLALFASWDDEAWYRALAPPDRARLQYWRGRAAWTAGAGQRAVDDWLEVRDLVPLSYEGVMADAWLERAGEPPRLRALVREALRRDGGAARLEPAALAGLELLELGFDDLARTELAWQSQLRGGEAPVAGAAAAAWLGARGERGAAIWTLGRQAEPSRWSRDAVVDVPAAGWRAAWPLDQLRPLAMASEASGQPTSRLLAFARRESAFATTAVSGAGARGLMQLLPETARIQARDVAEIEHVARRDLDDPYINARLGAQMLVAMDARFGGCVELMSSAYSAGPGRADAWLERTPLGFSDVWTERIPYPVVRDYAREIVVSEAIYGALLDEPERSALCVLPDAF